MALTATLHNFDIDLADSDRGALRRSSCVSRGIPRALVAALCARLDRRMAFAISITDREMFISIGDATLTGAARRIRWERPLVSRSSAPHGHRRHLERLSGKGFPALVEGTLRLGYPPDLVFSLGVILLA